MNRYIRPLSVVSASFLLINWGASDTSVENRAKPAINFYGTIKDNTASDFKAENITLGGQFRQIAVYPLPTPTTKSATYDPTINTVFLDFAEIARIEVPNPYTTHTFNNREYITIRVTSRDAEKTVHNYTIELTKKIFCEQINGAGALERELKLTAVETIIFEGHKDQPAVTTAVDGSKKYKALMVPCTPKTTKSA
jgi:hypothetical protein